MSKPEVRWHRVVLAYPCPDCDAAPGERCVTRNGWAKYEPHVARSRVAASHRWLTPEELDELDHPNPRGTTA